MAKRRGWGTGQAPYQKGPGRWAFRYRLNGTRREEGGFASKIEAQQALDVKRGELAAERRERAGLPPDPRRLPPLGDLVTAWLERRQHTHRSWTDDRTRWSLHLAPFFEKRRAADVDLAAIRSFAEGKRRDGMTPGLLGLCIRCLSTIYTDLCERPLQTGVERNPVIGLPKSLRRLWRSEHDPRFTPYVQRMATVVALFQSMAEPQRVAYAIGACAGLRTCELPPLEWASVCEEEPRIDVRWGVRNGHRGPLKDDEARILQGEFLAPLVPILRAWRAKTGGRGLLFPPALTRTPGKRVGLFMHPRRLWEGLGEASAALGQGEVMAWDKPWYQATRHTCATHWLRGGHSLGELATVLGHSSTWVTERYAHIRPSGGRDLDPWKLDLLRPEAPVISLENGHRMGTDQDQS